MSKRNIFKWWKKENPVGALIPVSSGQPKNTPRNYKQLSDEGYVKNNVCFSAVNIVCGNFSQIKFTAVNQAGEALDSHPALDLLKRPNSQMGMSEFLYAVAAYRLLNGNSYINAVGSGAGDDGTQPKAFIPTELWVNRADKYKILEGTTSPVGGFEYTGSMGRTKKFGADQITGFSNVLHWKTFHPTDDYYGLSAIEAAAVGIDIYNSAMDWNNAFFSNGARPSGALFWTGEGNMPDKSFNSLKKQIDETYSGSANNGRPLLLDGNLEWKQFSLSPKDMDFIQAKDTTAMDIARVFSVDPCLLNIGTNATFNNKSEARMALWEENIIPLGENLVAELNTWLMPRYGDGVTLKLDVSGVSALEAKREAAWKRANDADFLTYNEKRKMVGLAPEDGGDDILIPANLIPITFDSSSDSSNSEASDEKKKLNIYTDFESKQFEMKLIDGSRRAEKREQAIQDRIMTALERPFARKVNNVLNKYVNKAALELGKDQQASVDALLIGIEKDLSRIYDPHYADVMTVFGKRTVSGLKSSFDHIEIKQVEDDFLIAMEEWIEANAALRVAMVADTTKALIKEGVALGLAESATGSEMAKIIMAKAGLAIAKNRSVVIARTETHTAASAGSIESAKASGVELLKVWISAEDERTREDHVNTDSSSHSQPLAMDAMFSVGGDSMEAPGMGNDAGQNINCRCVLGYKSF